MTRPINFDVKMVNIRRARYSIDNPNPEYNTKGERWINIALSEWDGKNYNVAYIPKIPIKITSGTEIYDMIPVGPDLDKSSNYANLCMGGIDGRFWLNGLRIGSQGFTTKGRCCVNLFPNKDEDRLTLLELFKIADKIYDPLNTYSWGHIKEKV